MRARVEELIRSRVSRFNSRIRGSGRQLDLHFDITEEPEGLFIRFVTKRETAYLLLPLPYRDASGAQLIGVDVPRVVCPVMLAAGPYPHIPSYEDLILFLLSDNTEEYLQAGKRNFLDAMVFGFFHGRGRPVVSRFQKTLNAFLSKHFPLAGLPLQNWVANRRLVILDGGHFDSLRPRQKLEYQVRKNEELFPWTSNGISDGAAATRNYILQTDLRDLVPFGWKHHNPFRNLYSTLGMKGEETAWVVSEKMEQLERQGVKRGGWNWMTVFLDLPLNFEDQILVSRRHAGKEVSTVRSFTIFGKPLVKEGQELHFGSPLGENEDGSLLLFEVEADRAVVEGIRVRRVPFDGTEYPVRVIDVRVFFRFKEGFKITNQHGNKGIIILEDLGTVKHPKLGEIPIDVIASARSIQKRKNFGQVLEMATTVLKGPGVRTVVTSKAQVDLEKLQERLREAGLPEDGAFEVSTPWGDFRTMAGWMCWGVIKTPEDQVWRKRQVTAKNLHGLRTKGTKVSIIEFRSLTTLLGVGSHVVKEILSYQQGTRLAREKLLLLDTLRGNLDERRPVVNPEQLVYHPQALGSFLTQEQVAGTILDETRYPKGAYMKLPFSLRVTIPEGRQGGEIVEEVASGGNAYHGPQGEGRVFETNLIPIPIADLRRPWKHPSGRLGMPRISSALNRILESLDRLKSGEIKVDQVALQCFRYYHDIAHELSTKTGDLAQYLMSVRYPWSTRATAVLGRDLPPNWIEIHSSMAEDLQVKTGDPVLVERFPCLGFMSLRVQKVRVTDDPECKYVIRVSGNSLVSANLDFDGDVLYVMSFRSPGARRELLEAFEQPHPSIKREIDRLNSKKAPITGSMSIPEVGLTEFPDPTPKRNAQVMERALAVKIFTGPVIALCYNLMRIAEACFSYKDRESHINVEVFLDKVGNSIFSQKHGTAPLADKVTEAVCMADPRPLIDLGFPERESRMLCDRVRELASSLGIRGEESLREHFRRHREEGRSNVINLIVRRMHKMYFATRADLHPILLLEHLEEEPKDLPSFLLRRSLESS